MSVLKNLTNCWTDMVLLYSEAPHSFWEILYLGVSYLQPLKNFAPGKSPPPQKKKGCP